ncbi:bacterio-opsin activator domain-containing protein [Natrialbaceae archaeon GCM10025810]|uniref:bacterio-opsin activator domain-containing protein n=1 Tax=Halovalidus salilacus TaxID=3075124 RepID=UPI003619C0EC
MDRTDAGTTRAEIGDADRAAAALEHVVDPVVTVVDGTIAYANAAACEAFDLDLEAERDGDATDGEGSGVRAAEAIFGPSWERLEAAVEETTVGTVRHVDLDRDGYGARVHRGVDGATITFDGSASDPPDGDRAVKARAINEAPVGVTLSDPNREDNPLVYINDAYQEITGYDFDDVVGRNCRFLQGPDSDEKAIAAMRAAIDEERPVTVELENYRKDGTKFWNEVTVAPVRNDRGEVTNYVGFQNDVTARKEAELEAERRTRELEYVLDRVEGLVQDVTAAVAGSTSRSELERAVCERIVEEGAYDAAWIGERNPATDAIAVRAGAGDSVAGDDAEPIPIDADHPAAEALRSDTVAIDRTGDGSRAAFPLSYNGIEYGALLVRTGADSLGTDRGDRETVVLSALARAVASGINARETSRTLATDAVVALDLDVTDPSLAPVALSEEADCRLEYRRSTHRRDEETASLFTATGATPDDLETAADDLGLDLEVLVDRDGECLIELRDGDGNGDGFVAWLSERGVRVRAIDADEGRARVTLEIPRSSNVRAVVEAVEDRYPSADAVAFRRRERGGETRQEFAARLEEALTERQFDALQRAYLGGYFEWPRPATGEELARSMGVSRPTFHEHLRSAEAKLCRAFFGDE